MNGVPSALVNQLGARVARIAADLGSEFARARAFEFLVMLADDAGHLTAEAARHFDDVIGGIPDRRGADAEGEAAPPRAVTLQPLDEVLGQVDRRLEAGL